MALRISKVYTRSGDKGNTHLVGGGSISKGDLQMEVVGSFDELNCHLGMLRTHTESSFPELTTQISAIQNKVFDMGSLCACPLGNIHEAMKQMQEADVTWLEEKLDEMQEGLSDLKSFTLPGGSLENAQAHVARTVCRRVERLLVRLQEAGELPEQVLQYTNRLSDYLFVVSRWVLKEQGKTEYLWQTPLD